MLLLLLSLIFLSLLECPQSYEILPNSLLNRTQSCQINCTRNQTFVDKFTKIPQCHFISVRICEGYLGIDFNNGLVSYGFTRADAANDSSLIRADLINDYRSYIDTNITAIRFRQLKMKFSKQNPHRLNIHYYCRTQIDDCAYQEIETIYPIYIANRHILKRIQPIFYNESIAYGTPISCNNDIVNENSILCSGYCILTLGLHRMMKSCNETLSPNALGINMSLGLAYPDNPQFTDQVSSLTLVCNKPNCNSNASINEVLIIVNDFLTAQSFGTRKYSIIHYWLLLIYERSFFFLFLND